MSKQILTQKATLATWRHRISRLMVLLLLTSSFSFAQEKAKEGEEGEGEAAAKVTYVEMKPPFITNPQGGPDKLGYVKAEVSLRIASEAVAKTIEEHMPLLRHQLVLLLSSETADELAKPEAQENLRVQALKAVNDALQNEDGALKVEDLLFTSFVIQR